MLKLILLLCGTLAAVAATECGAIERLVIKEQWSNAYGMGKDREVFGEEIWHHIFDHTPASRGLFDRVHGNNIFSAEFRAHSLRVLGGLDMCIGLLDDQSALNAQLAHLKAQHIKLKIPAAYFDAFKAAMLETVQHHVGECFNQDAWSHCLDALNEGIKE